MDFDEYEYLEKTVEESEDRSGSSKKKESDEKRERGYRRREEEEDDEQDESERRRKKSRGEDENGDKKRGDRERSERRREKDDRHRSDRDGEKDRDREKRDREKDKERRDREKREREKEKEREKERERRSSSRSRRHDSRDQEREKERELREREREREIGPRDGRRFKDKKEGEPEVDPERDQRTVFAYQMPLKAMERDVYEFFSTAGKVRDVRLIMDRNSRRSKGVGYVEFYDAMSVPMAIAMSGQLLHGQPVMVKPSEAEKNLVQSTATAGGSNVTGPYGPTDRKLYVGNLHFNMTEQQLRQIFEPFGPVELVQLPLDLETGQCKGFGFVQFVQVEHAKAAQSLNGNLEIAGRVIKVSSVTEHVTSQEAGTTTADFDDDDGGGLSLNAQSRALLMQKLDRTGTASSMAGTLGVSMLNGSAPVQPGITMPFSGQAAFPAAALPGQVLTSLSTEIVGSPTECLLLKNLFDPTAENDPDFYLDVKEDVEVECSKFGPVKHVYLDRNAAQVYLRFDNKEAASSAQRAMHNRWFAQRLISAVFMEPQDYDAKFKDAA